MCKIQYPDDKYVTLATTNWFILFAVICYLNEAGRCSHPVIRDFIVFCDAVSSRLIYF